MVASPNWRETLQRTGWTDAHLDGAAFRQFLLAEQARVQAVLGRLNQRSSETRAAAWQPTSRTAPAIALIACALLAVGVAWQQRGRVAMTPVLPIAPTASLVAVLALQAVGMPLVGFVPMAAGVFATTTFTGRSGYAA